MTLLHVAPGRHFGGAERLLLAFARAQKEVLVPELNHQFAFFYDGKVADQLRRWNLPVYLLGAMRFSRPWTLFRARRALSALVGRLDSDLVVSHGGWAHAIAGPVLHRRKVDEVFWIHDPPSNHWFERLGSFTPPKLAITFSQATRMPLASLFDHVPARTLYYPVYGVDPHSIAISRARLRAEFGTPPDRLVIIQASRWVPWKGHRFLVEGLARLSEDPRWECWVVGGAQTAEEVSYRREIEQLTQRLKLETRVRFLGHRDDVPTVLCAADILCQPNTRAEPFGVVFIEAMLARLPVITSLGEGVSEAVDSTTGILIPTGDPNAVAESLARLLNDNELREKLGARGAQRAFELCDPRTQIRKFLDLAEGVLEKQKSPWGADSSKSPHETSTEVLKCQSPRRS